MSGSRQTQLKMESLKDTLWRENQRALVQSVAPVAQLDRVAGFEPVGWVFDSPRARQIFFENLVLKLR